MARKERTYYVSASVQGAIAVEVRATSKTAALERIKNGSWDDVFDVSLEFPKGEPPQVSVQASSDW